MFYDSHLQSDCSLKRLWRWSVLADHYILPVLHYNLQASSVLLIYCLWKNRSTRSKIATLSICWADMAAMPDPLCVTAVRLLGNVYVSVLCVCTALNFHVLCRPSNVSGIKLIVFQCFRFSTVPACIQSNLVQSLPSVPACLAFA